MPSVSAAAMPRAHQPGRRIIGADAFEGHLVIHEWVDAQPRLRVLFRDPKGKAPWYNGTGVVLYVTGMMISAFALRGLA